MKTRTLAALAIGAVLAATGAAIAAETIWGTVGGRAQQQMPFAVFPSINGGQFYTMKEPLQLFVDDFGTGTLNTISRWNTPTTGGGGNAIAATNAVGATALGTGTVAGGFSQLSTQLIFPDKNPGYLRFQSNINLPPPGSTGQYILFGFANLNGTPTGAAPCNGATTNAVAFGFNLLGKLEAFTCASGSKTLIADLSVQQSGQPVQTSPGIWTAGCGCLPQPPDIASYKYLIDFRGDNINWYTEAADGTINRVAYTSRGAAGPDVNQLSVSYLAIAGATPPAVSATIVVNQTTVGDTAGNPISAIANVSGSGTGVGSLVLKASPGSLISLYATCTAACWLMVFNSTSTAGLPTSGAATTGGTALNNLQECIPITAANGLASINYAPGPFEQFSVGITAAISSTNCFTYTTAATAFIHGTVQ